MEPSDFWWRSGGSSLSPGVERRERIEKSRGRTPVVANQAVFTSAIVCVCVLMCVRLIGSEEKGGSMVVKLFLCWCVLSIQGMFGWV